MDASLYFPHKTLEWGQCKAGRPEDTDELIIGKDCLHVLLVSICGTSQA